MTILFAASEAVPLIKTGGLADVVGALPKALAQAGEDVRVILPKYGGIQEQCVEQLTLVATFTVQFGWRQQYCGLLQGEFEGVRFYLIDNEHYFKRGGLYGYDDDAERFVFFCFAVMEAARHIDSRVSLIHCHDWQTGLIPFLLKTRYAYDSYWQEVRSVFTIHNLKYQGLFGIDLLKDLTGAGDELFRPETLEFHGAASCMKGGLLYADKLTTVSETYAQEIQTPYYGEGLDELLRFRKGDLVGIVNGIDEKLFNPSTDPALAHPYSTSLQGKRLNKLALQRELGLAEDEDALLIGCVSRLVSQKGFDLVMAVLDEMLSLHVQFVVLGTGDGVYEDYFRRTATNYPTKCCAWIGYDEAVASRIYAGSDLLLMPSQFEPCGLSQLIALRYLSIPLVRETGGLKDTVQPYNQYTGEGNGFSFSNYNAHELLFTVQRAVTLYESGGDWSQLVNNALQADYSWSQSAKRYQALYDELRG